MSSLLAQPERGATAVLTGVLMVVLVGFAGLAIDGGATYAKYQELQNGADAAALAAAQECAENEVACTIGSLQPVVDSYGKANVRNDTQSVAADPPEIDRDAREVTVTVSGRQTHWFMGVLGISETELSPNATATWGSPYSGPATLPFAISECEFADALGEPILGTVLDIYMPKNGRDAECGWGSDYPPGGFGWLTKAGCEVPVRVADWVDGATGIDDPKGCVWESYIGEVVLVPIFDDYRGDGNNGEFHVARFAALEVLGIRPTNGENSQVGDECEKDPDPKQKYHKICVRGVFIKYATIADGYEVDPDGEKTEVSVVRLID